MGKKLVFADKETDDYDDLDVRRAQVAECEYGIFEIDFVLDTHDNLSHFEVYFIRDKQISTFIGTYDELNGAVELADNHLEELRKAKMW